MSLVRQIGLGAWYYASLPWRKVRGPASPVIIFFYHRVADGAPNPWTITNAGFRKQIEWLWRRFDLVSLEEAQRRIRAKDSPRPAAAITFDDGYAENCEQALPWLIEHKIPCTYFVATRFVLDGEPFPHDAEVGRALPVNTPEQIRELAHAGVEIGAHTRNHIDLGRVTGREILENEIIGSADDLATIIGRRPRYFAFPFGRHCHLNAEAFDLARAAGFAGVCSAFGGYNVLGDDAFHLKRFHGDPDLLRVKNWATVDPRKSFTTLPFHYEKPASHAAAKATEAPA